MLPYYKRGVMSNDDFMINLLIVFVLTVLCIFAREMEIANEFYIWCLSCVTLIPVSLIVIQDAPMLAVMYSLYLAHLGRRQIHKANGVYSE